MKFKTTVIIAAVALLLPSCGSSSPPKGYDTSKSSGHEAVAASAPYRISGAGLMMTPDQVASALQPAGYRWSEADDVIGMGVSFEDQVEQRITGKPDAHARRVPYYQEWKKGREVIRIHYGAYPGGPRAISYHWETDEASPSEDEIRSTLEKRYGPGWRLKSFLPEQWCTPMPCSDASAIISPGVHEIDLSAPSILGQPISLNQRLDAAARAKGGAKSGSFYRRRPPESCRFIHLRYPRLGSAEF